MDLAIEFLFALTNDRFVKRFAWIDGPSRQAPPSIPISGLQEQHASGLVGDDRMCAQSVPVVESHLEPNSGLKIRWRMEPSHVPNEPSAAPTE
jgi:hypothetical protein